MASLSKGGRWVALAALCAIAAVGLFRIAPGYGMSTDEQVNFDVGVDTLRAYRSAAGFQDYLTHGEPLAHHGPSYFAIWAALSRGLARLINGWRLADARHLVNFISYVLAIVCLYVLMRRLVAGRYAWMTAALFASQPLLFGHAFINQKDTPFMAFFLVSTVAGMAMVDRLARRPAAVSTPAEPVNSLRSSLGQDWSGMARGHQVLVLLILLVLALVLLDVVLLETPHRLANQLVAAAYMGRAPAPLVTLFSRVAQDAYKTPLAEYQAKASWAYWAYGRMAELMAAGLVGAAALAKLHPATQRYVGRGQRWWPALPLLAGAFVGFTVAIRPIGGLAGLLVSGFALWRLRGRAWAVVAIYASAAAVVAYLAWPYLWPAPLPRFLSGLGFSAAFDPKPTQFRGRIVRGDALPWDYFPTLATIQLTEPISVLFLAGLGAAIGRWRAHTVDRPTLVLLAVWLLVPLFALIGLGVGVYNNLRQLHFLLPVVLAVAGLGLAWAMTKLRRMWVQYAIFAVTLLPGLVGIAQLRPYEYAYFNSYVGGVRGAADDFALEYWCTSYREAMAYVNQVAAPGDTVLAFLAPENARPFARKDITVTDNERDLDDVQYVLTCTYAMGDDWSAIPMVRLHTVARQGVSFAEVFEMLGESTP